MKITEFRKVEYMTVDYEGDTARYISEHINSMKHSGWSVHRQVGSTITYILEAKQ